MEGETAEMRKEPMVLGEEVKISCEKNERAIEWKK